MWKAGLALALAIAALLATLAVPLEEWRTGDQRLAPLAYAPPVPAALPARVWIDTDAACGHGERTDPDDCFAIALLARVAKLEIAGISTVPGNAPREVVERTTAELAARLSAETGREIAVHGGVAARLAFAAALEAGPLTIVALGPLTNLAAVLEARPDLRPQVARLVAVMGRRPGHIFHPGENAGSGSLLGHGPVFCDFNFAMDVDAAARIVALGLPTTLIPYDAARGIELTADDLDRLAASGGASAWLAEGARAWLRYWRDDIGRQGFYPFDLVAAAFLVEPRRFGCAPVRASVSVDKTLFVPFWRPTALLVDQADSPLDEAQAVGFALYCGRAEADLKPRLLERLTKGGMS